MKIKKKTKKAVAKRIKANAAGKLFHMRACYQHKRVKKRPQYKRQARRPVEVKGAERKRLLKVLNV
ncbi:TPA: hypothetical protein EYP13_05530 [Candidatus Micrarchaeota archaeon]|nr:hypothetical protein [Candidatus Micrarchaeota archaeon]